MNAHVHNWLKRRRDSLYRASLSDIHPDWYALVILAVVLAGLSIYTVVTS